MAEVVEGSLLVVVIDANPSSTITKSGNEQIMTKCLNSVIVLCNTHLMMSSRNDLAVIACTAHKSAYLYPSPTSSSEDDDKRPTDGQYELLSNVGTSIKEGMKALVQEIPPNSTQTESLLAGSMSIALCYIHRMQKAKTNFKESQARILVVTSSGDSASQYMNFMNVFFTAQKYGLTIDACVINKDAGILQQGCDITDGVYLKIPNIGAFVQYLLWVFLPDVRSRKELLLPAKVHVDYRAACFCHRNLIEIGYVCSVCLSIFCSFSPICSTCQTTFKFMGPMAALKPKKKKMKIN